MYPLQIADLDLPFRYFLNNGAVRMQFLFTLYKEKVSVGSKKMSFKPGIRKHDFL